MKPKDKRINRRIKSYERFDDDINNLELYGIKEELKRKGKEAIINAFKAVINSRKRRIGRKRFKYVWNIAKEYNADWCQLKKIYDDLLGVVQQCVDVVNARCVALRRMNNHMKDPTSTRVFDNVRPDFLQNHVKRMLKVKTDEVINSEQYKSKKKVIPFQIHNPNIKNEVVPTNRSAFFSVPRPQFPTNELDEQDLFVARVLSILRKM